MGLEYLRSQLAADFYDYRESNWYGPGFYSATLDVLTLERRQQIASARLLEKLAKMQDHAHGYFGRQDNTVDLKIFHTSSCLSTLRAQSLSPSAASAEQAVRWLESVQDPDSGRWGTGVDRMDAMFTAYAVMALVDFRGVDSSAVRKGLQWLQSRQDRDGRVESIEGTVTALWCFAKVYKTPTSPAIPMNYIVELRALLGEYERTTAVLQARAVDVVYQLESAQKELDAEHDRYFFRLTERRAAQIGWIVGILGLVLTILMVRFPL